MKYSVDEITWAAQLASIVEVCSEKPGNVHINQYFGDANPLDFFAGAVAIGPVFQRVKDLSVGDIVLKGVESRSKLSSTNVNLGILLLLAPLAKASVKCESGSGAPAIKDSLKGVLDELSEDDAVAVFRAIRLSNAGGIGYVDRYDVREDPQGITLLDAMYLAQERDSIAKEYVTNFAITFEVSLPSLKDTLGRGTTLRDAILHTYLVILAEIPDTLIARKLGLGEAFEVSKKAFEAIKRGSIFTLSGREAIKDLDCYLRDEKHARNPGTTADLTVSGLFLFFLDSIRCGTVSSYLGRW
ncbi:MAG TPA: triphosphoribosyl-dephospho-CoA synthase [Acetomicrobium sp.]|uniref:triphosphoribosyl-dephospho-CoA synthase n=1 Tax=Acetomicrobium mobile TaxID=97477 RepID=UPI0026EF07F7|nr:triphosphoribosyl-dephospho-CoA synthase [Acetomicrobium mobile]HQA36642.1 triphosphoribosyl-dephospho-CoA synthase [Acetomicrobium sp.]